MKNYIIREKIFYEVSAMDHNLHITWSGVSLKPLSYEDSQKYRQLRNRDENRKCFIFSGIISQEEQKEWYEAYLHHDDDYMFSVYDKQGQFLGGAALYHIDEVDRTAEFGRLLIDKKAAGQTGVGYLVLQACCLLAEKEFNLHTLHLDVQSDNIAAYKTYLKAGFILKKQCLLPSDASADRKLYYYMEKQL